MCWRGVRALHYPLTPPPQSQILYFTIHTSWQQLHWPDCWVPGFLCSPWRRWWVVPPASGTPRGRTPALSALRAARGGSRSAARWRVASYRWPGSWSHLSPPLCRSRIPRSPQSYRSLPSTSQTDTKRRWVEIFVTQMIIYCHIKHHTLTTEELYWGKFGFFSASRWNLRFIIMVSSI